MILIRKLKRRLFQFEVLVCLATARLLILFVDFRKWRSALGLLGQGAASYEEQVLDLAQIKYAKSTGREVALIARRARFDAVCLPQAMAARWLLARRGISSHVVMGSRRDIVDGALLLHAWLMVGDNIITGASEAEEFTAFRVDAGSQDAQISKPTNNLCDVRTHG